MAKSPVWQRSEGKNCTKCKIYAPLSFFYTTGKKVDGSPKYNSWCKSCVKGKMASYHQETWGEDALQHSAFKRTKSFRSYLSYLRSKAITRLGNCISTDDLVNIWNAQNGKCAMSGWEMTMKLGAGVIPTNCSIDKIDPNKGYETGNVQLVCRAINVAKSDLPIALFIQMCAAITEKEHAQNTSLAA